MRILEAQLLVSDAALAATEHFYRDELGLPAASGGLRAGYTTIELTPVRGEPFYHFALRVPKNRLAAAREWAARRTEILHDVRFDNWSAAACYLEDPAGNIVELIAHGELPEESSNDGPFEADELLGMCELGLVGPDTGPMAASLGELGIELWDGSLERGRLAFMGSREGVLILSPVGRGWMPTSRPAEPHPVNVRVTGSSAGEAVLPGTPHRIRTLPSG
jgi:catechol 2,3-dioxygenase-like lactoylglutathione lyase family enzyme